MTMTPTTGRIDVHSHLLPGIDDGCPTLEDSFACARMLVGAGYTHSFCTPHVWPSLPENTIARIPQRVTELQSHFNAASIKLKLLPGGEMNFRADLADVTRVEDLVSYGMARQFLLIDIWVDKLPPYFETTVRWLQSAVPNVVLAHPERMRAVQDDPRLVERFVQMGLLLQGNLQCLADPVGSSTRRTMERLLPRDVYFTLGTDLHNAKSLPQRMEGLRRAEEVLGTLEVQRLTIDNPRRLLPAI